MGSRMTRRHLARPATSGVIECSLSLSLPLSLSLLLTLTHSHSLTSSSKRFIPNLMDRWMSFSTSQFHWSPCLDDGWLGGKGA